MNQITIIPVPSIKLLKTMNQITILYYELRELEQDTQINDSKVIKLRDQAIDIINKIIELKKQIEYDHTLDVKMISDLRIKYKS